MNVRGIGFSHTGACRERNEDSMLVDNLTGLYAVSDGLGGHPAGDVASALAIEAVAQYVNRERAFLNRFRGQWIEEDQLAAIAAGAIEHACRVIYETGQAAAKMEGMGCTLTVLLVGYYQAGIAHVGDSRLYLSRNQRTRQLSSVHTLGHELLRMGVIKEEVVGTLADGDSLMRAVGVTPRVAVDQMLIDLKHGDRFILCTDGLSDHLDQPGDLDQLLDAIPWQSSAEHLVDFANMCGGHDNATAVVVDIDSSKREKRLTFEADTAPLFERGAKSSCAPCERCQ
ncbi:MAG: protein phosphatase 2C domain-containing protein [Myxococcota bacterium]